MWTAKKRGILKLENSTANRSEHASAGMHAQTDASGPVNWTGGCIKINCLFTTSVQLHQLLASRDIRVNNIINIIVVQCQVVDVFKQRLIHLYDLATCNSNSKKGKGIPYSTAECEVPELILVLGSQPAGDVSHKRDGRLPLLYARPAVTLTSHNP